MLREFKEFLFRGNIVDLAVAIVVGTAFVALVNAFVADILTPIIAAIFGKPDFSGLTFHINGSTFQYGDFLNELMLFVEQAPFENRQSIFFHQGLRHSKRASLR